MTYTSLRGHTVAVDVEYKQLKWTQTLPKSTGRPFQRQRVATADLSRRGSGVEPW
jgi:hypothetical protein